MLPISVVVPHKRSRAEFFRRYVLPSIEANRPAEILIEENGGGDPRLAAICRNRGAAKATREFICFADDDTIYGSDYLSTLHAALEKDAAAYAYGDYFGLPMPGFSMPLAGEQLARAFDPVALCTSNYIHTSALIRREASPRFDESLGRLQDWDLWLTLLEAGYRGLYVPGARLLGFVIDVGITASDDLEHWIGVIRRKHGI